MSLSAYFFSFTSSFLNLSVQDGDIDPNNKTDTIRQIIREKYISDTSVTIVLIGSDTWKRKHVDWEIHAAMYDSDPNPQMGILVINLPTINQSIRSSSNDEKPLLSDNTHWFSLKTRQEFDDHYPFMPSRLIDNFVKGVPITVVEWDRIQNNPQILKQLIDNAYNRRFDVTYDHSAPLRRQNS